MGGGWEGVTGTCVAYRGARGEIAEDRTAAEQAVETRKLRLESAVKHLEDRA